MNKEAASIFESSGCLSEQELLDYLEGRMAPERAHEVEVHLSGCPFCRDALEGLGAVRDRDRIPLIVRQLQGQMRRELESHRSGAKRTKRYVWLSALILLVLVILLVAYFALYFSMKKERERRSAPPAPAAQVRGTVPAERIWRL